MNGSEQRLSIQRILVALDASSQSQPAVETAVELANRLGAELIGLFVEDINLFRAAELPFAMEVGPFSPILRRLQIPELERQFRAQAALMRRILAVIAERRSVPWDFRIARGTVALEILSAEAEADLVIVGKGRWPMGKRLGSTTQTVVFRGRGLTLVLHEGCSLTVPVVAVYDGSAQAEKALEAARQLTRVKDGSLKILVVAPDAVSAQRLEKAAREYLKNWEQEGDVCVVIRPTLPRLIFTVQGMGPVVLPMGMELLSDNLLGEFISMIRNPVLLVR